MPPNLASPPGKVRKALLNALIMVPEEARLAAVIAVASAMEYQLGISLMADLDDDPAFRAAIHANDDNDEDGIGIASLDDSDDLLLLDDDLTPEAELVLSIDESPDSGFTWGSEGDSE